MMGADGFFRSISFFLRIEKRERAHNLQRERAISKKTRQNLFSLLIIYFFLFFFFKESFFDGAKKAEKIFFSFFSFDRQKKKFKNTTNTSEKKFTRRSPLGTRRRTRAL
jgi:hypothetical protein